MVAFLLTNLFSDQVNPDCLDPHVSLNETLKKIEPQRQGHAWESKMAGFRQAPLGFFSLLEELLYKPGEILHDKKDEILMFMILEERNKTCRNAEVRTDTYVVAQMEGKSETSYSYLPERSTFGGGFFELESKIGLSIKGTGNLIFDRKIRI